MASLKDRGCYCPVAKRYVTDREARLCVTINRLFNNGKQTHQQTK